MNRLRIIIIFGIMTHLFGCGKAAPEGFPKTAPCQVIVKKGGTPIEAASVVLVPEQPMSSIVLGGSTDSSGKAEIRTSRGGYSQTGVPEGDYTVMVAKTLPIEMPTLSNEEFYSQTPQQKAAREKEYKEKLEKARIVPEILSGAKSPLKLKVDSTGGVLEVDLSQY